MSDKKDASKKDEKRPADPGKPQPEPTKEERAERFVGGPDDIAVKSGTVTIL